MSMLPFAACVALAALHSIFKADLVDGRTLRDDRRELADLPGFIACPSSLLVSAAILDPAYACSPAYYNCLGVPSGHAGPLTYCDGESVRTPRPAATRSLGHPGYESLHPLHTYTAHDPLTATQFLCVVPD